MRIWQKIIIDKSNKIKKFNLSDRKNYYPEIIDRKSSDWAQFCQINESYKSKEEFLNKHLINRFKIWDRYLTNNLNKSNLILSIGSGRGINELALIDKKFSIVCSDLAIPETYNASKKIFSEFKYVKFNILEDRLYEKYNAIFSLHTFYLFSEDHLKIAFENINNLLDKDGLFIVDMNAEDNLFSFFYHNIYLFIESYFIYFISKLLKKNIGLVIDKNFGFKFKKKEILRIAKEKNFEILDIYSDGYNEMERSFLIKKLVKKFPFFKNIFARLFKLMPFHNIYKFKKL